MNFTVSAATDALTLTYDSSDGDVELANVSILPSNSLAVTQSTKGVTGSYCRGAIGCWIYYF